MSKVVSLPTLLCSARQSYQAFVSVKSEEHVEIKQNSTFLTHLTQIMHSTSLFWVVPKAQAIYQYFFVENGCLTSRRTGGFW